MKANSKSNVKSNIKTKSNTIPSPKVESTDDEESIAKVYIPRSTEPSSGRIIFGLSNEVIALAEKGQISEALSHLNDMVAKSYPPHPRCYSKILIACKKVSDGVSAFETLELMVDRDRINPSCYDMRRVISTCGAAVMWERAVEAFEAMEMPDVVDFNAVILACEKSRQWNKVIDIYDTMKAKNVEPEEVTYSMVLNACAKGVDKTEKASEVSTLLRELEKSNMIFKEKPSPVRQTHVDENKTNINNSNSNSNSKSKSGKIETIEKPDTNIDVTKVRMEKLQRLYNNYYGL